MKLDYNCARDLLLFLESELKIIDTPYGLELTITSLDRAVQCLPSYSKEVISYTTLKLSEAGYIEVDCEYGDECYHNFLYSGITFNGHQYLDSIRSEPIWSQILNEVKAKGLSLTFDVIKAVATKLLTAALT